jgi:uncharacterized cupin superfamily protein
MSDRVFNLRSLEFPPEEGWEPPEGHSFRGRSLSEEVGSTLTGMGVYEIEPGNAMWPYHFELVEEEWLIVIDGEVTLRTPEGERQLRAGDVACFPAGPSGAHAVRNHGTAAARVAMPSSVAPYGDAVVYPDSGKFRVGGGGFNHRGRLGDEVPYWEGEP